MSLKISFVLVFNYIFFANANVLLNFTSPTTTKFGFVFPHRGEKYGNVTYVLEGIDIIFHLAKVPDGFDTCKLTTADTEKTYTLAADAGDSSDKISFWSPTLDKSGCGARIKNLAVSDSGRWRLRAINTADNKQYQSFLNLKVLKNFDRPNENFIVREGESDEINVTYLANYCEISNPPLYGKYNVYDQCHIAIEKVKKIYGGKWVANVGVFGQMEEIVLRPNVTVLEEQFEVGYNISGSKINLYCNLKNLIENTTISFCRFRRDGDTIGYRSTDGLSNGEYSYYGNTIGEGDCGLTIEKPTKKDNTRWKCSLGVYRNNGLTFEVKESIISVVKTNRRNKRDTANTENKQIKEILAGVGYSLTVNCDAGERLRYCVITHPNGTFYAIQDKIEDEVWMPVGNLDLGQCGMTILTTSINETGTWHCQMGLYNSVGMDITETLTVRVGETALVAQKTNLTAAEGDQLTLSCKSVTTDKSLEYCIFQLPDVGGFSIDDTITFDKAIDNLYWYNNTSGSLAKGDCQVTINEVNANHFGAWICTGKIPDAKEKLSYAYIYVERRDDAGLTVASISGIAIGVVAALVLTGGGLIYYKRHKTNNRRRSYGVSIPRSSSSEVAEFQVARSSDPVEQERRPEIVVHEDIEMVGISSPSAELSTTRQETTEIN